MWSQYNTSPSIILPQTRTPLFTSNKYLLMILEGWFSVIRSLHVCVRPESLVSLGRHSPAKSTQSHCWSSQFLCSWHHRKRHLRWAVVNVTRSTVRHANELPLCPDVYGKTQQRESSSSLHVFYDFSRCLPPVPFHLPLLNPWTAVLIEMFYKIVIQCCERSPTPHPH